MADRRASYQAGLWAERVTAFYLRLKGYRIVAHRFKNPLGEIDLLAVRGQTLAIIEVKRRPTQAAAADSISYRQRQRLVRGAQFALAQWPEFGNHTVRFDAVLISRWGWPQHLVNAWAEDASL